VLASRKELVEYDKKQRESAMYAKLPVSASSTAIVTPPPVGGDLAAADVKDQPTKPRERWSLGFYSFFYYQYSHF